MNYKIMAHTDYFGNHCYSTHPTKKSAAQMLQWLTDDPNVTVTGVYACDGRDCTPIAIKPARKPTPLIMH